ncbi:E3 ubiquitin-protein ligase EL5-like [Oryza brachyantha]|uniref:E3 ubiquitin-protein ligase EL5-like n=1 Tax=Oryza brachyantha TaxID=4533 RepID=UPI001ADD29CD|nr:E3 ubiquitin-protein ligase EL5-like [Oryza brachyantha]
MDVPRRSNGAWEINLVRRGPATARSDRCSRLTLLWFGVVGVVVALYVCVSYVWASIAAAALLAAASWFTWYYFGAAPAPPPVLPDRQPAALAGAEGGGLSQEDIEAIPAFEYRKGSSGGAPATAAVEQCAVCIAVVRDGDIVRRLPACGHAFHAPCVDGWLRDHATCPMCRADVKVAGEAPATKEAPAV